MIERNKRDAVIVEAVRTPIGKRGRGLAGVRPDELAALVLSALVKRSGVEPLEVDDVIVGCATPIGEQGWNVGRMAALHAGFPPEVPAVTINRMCASSDQAAAFAAQAVRAGDADMVIAAGVESMSRIEMGSDGRKPNPALMEKYSLVPQGISAEMMAEKYKLSREALDEYSLESHARAVESLDAGDFKRETIAVPTGTNGSASRLSADEGPRRDTSPEALAGLKPAFKEYGKITAGNSSQMSDGAAGLLIVSREKAESLGLTPRGRLIASASVGSDPVLQLEGPIPATAKALKKAGLRAEDIHLFEVNEAFASVVLPWLQAYPAARGKLNRRGGAIALGHPLGATGARLIVTLLHELEERGGGIGLSTMCIGHGMANATVIEVPG